MLYKYFRITRARIIAAILIFGAIFGLQYVMTGSLVSQQHITTTAGDSNSSVIGVLDDTEIIRQKFVFDRKVVLSSFAISFGSFEKKEVGKTLDIQMLDGNNNIVYEEKIPVKNITANAVYTVDMDHSVSIPEGVTCCIRLSCSSPKSEYEKIPTVNTTNRTDPNTYMSTLSMQTHKKSLNISYTYTYRQIYPLFIMIAEILFIFFMIFERLSEYVPILRKKRIKDEKRVKQINEEADKRAAEQKIKYNKQHNIKNQPENSVKKSSKKTKKKHTGKIKQNPIKRFVKYMLASPQVIFNIRAFLAILNPFVVSYILEIMNGTASTILINVWVFTWLLLMAVQLIFFAIIKNINVAMLVMDLILFPVGLANLFVLAVRGTPFLPSDILGVATATEVADHYTLTLSPVQFIALVGFIIWCIVLFKLKKKHVKVTFKNYIVRFVFSLAPAIAVICILYSTSVLENCGIADDVWNKASSCKKNGFYMNYFINMHYLKVSAPEKYSQKNVEKILSDIENTSTSSSSGSAVTKKVKMTNADFSTTTSLNGKKPNIILIMNESLADFSLINNNMSYNEDPLPFIHSLTNNTIKGVDYVSVFGAGTSNSEFEAMTGNTMTYFPSGSNVYQQFMHSSTFSLPSYLKSLDYQCTAIHPSSGANWNRVATYNSMKFDKFITIEDFKNPEYVRYISDKESYKKVIEQYEAKKKGQSIFMFDVTIQNHGGYLTNTNWKNPVYVKNAYYAQTKEYLSSIRVSDDAFKYLINYFEKVDEPTIICMFGDHFPSIETTFYEQLLGKEQSEWGIDDLQKRYGVPIIYWANYDIPESNNLVISNNYLENMLLKQSGLDLPLYNQYVEKVSETIPAMNVNGYMDSDLTWHYYGNSETDSIKEVLSNYEVLQYGYYSDSDKEKMAELFKMK